jgi:alginate O-acetyltransferase complex protein AlgI
MLFNSPLFVFFFLPALLLLYAAIPSMKGRNGALLAGSAVFYLWGEWENAWVLAALVVLGYLGSAWLRDERKRAKVSTLVFLIVLTLCPLIYYKYGNFFVAVAKSFTSNSPHALEKKWLPLGISFFTFQCISYLVDVYRKEVPPARNLREFALYITLFPHLIAGPIVRFKQLRGYLERRRWNFAKLNRGLRIFTAGLASKALIANPIGAYTDKIFAAPLTQIDGGQTWLGSLFFTFQIYFDFQGYSLMAIGLAAMFGFKFPINFNDPYQAQGITDFWRRWHISLSTWLRDYLYRPLSKRCMTPVAITITFLLSGLWHGANWNFILWGAYHGFFRVLELHPAYRKFVTAPVFGKIYTFLLLMVGWVIFRVEDLPNLGNYLKLMFTFQPPAMPLFNAYAELLPPDILFTLLIASLLSFSSHVSRYVRQIVFLDQTRHVAAQAIFMLLALVLSVAYMAAQTFNPFIYFRF